MASGHAGDGPSDVYGMWGGLRYEDTGSWAVQMAWLVGQEAGWIRL